MPSQDVTIDFANPTDVLAIITIAQTSDKTLTINNSSYNQDWYGATALWDSVIVSGSVYSERVVWGLFTITQTINQTEVLDNPSYDTETAGQIAVFSIITFNTVNSFRYLDQNKQPIIFSSRPDILMPIIFSSRTDPNMPMVFRSPGGIRYNINQIISLTNPNNNDDFSQGLPTISASKTQALVTMAQSKSQTQTTPLTNLSFKVNGQMVIFLGVQNITCSVVSQTQVQGNIVIQLSPIVLRINIINVVRTS